jgi:DNA-directed RNA polymerase specialized sigma54-like protein
LSKNNHKNVTIKRHNFTKSERECVKGIIHNLSFQRLTDQEIVQWLLDEKKIDIDRSTVSKMRNQVETKAEKWYIELKKSTYKFVAVYKERIDSLSKHVNFP